jgi:Protein of unknown function (DUF3455)
MSETPKVAAFLLVLLVAACASPQPPTTVKVPDALKPGANESLAMIVPARGVQIYECRARRDAGGGYEWAFVAPEADLFDARGNRIGRHYAGPHWESSDGSKILGTLKERADAPVPDAIPWLLLTAKSVGSDGSFSKVTSVQRVNTAGGLAPKVVVREPPSGRRLASTTPRTITSSRPSSALGAVHLWTFSCARGTRERRGRRPSQRRCSVP